MGLFNLIKIANDYAKAKKYLESRKCDVEKAKEYITKIKNFIEYVDALKIELLDIINNAKEILDGLKKTVKESK